MECQYGLQLGPLCFRFYGLILMLGAFSAALVARHLLKRSGKDPELVWDGLIWALVFGVIGARLYHVLTPSKTLLEMGIDRNYYFQHPLEILSIWKGGLGMPGALLGGVLGLWIFARRRKVNLALILDAAAPGVALAQAIGRWGNFVNQELYGPPTDLPWAIKIDYANRMAGYKEFETFHPLFLYESLWNLANFGLLFWLWLRFRDRLKLGDYFLIYLITYPVGRFLLEFIRLDYVPLGVLNLNQIFMLGVALVSAVVLILRHRR